MAFGLPTPADLNGIVTNLGTIVASVGPEEQAVLKAAIDQLGAHADALEDKAIAAESSAEDKLLAELKAWRAELKPIPDFVARLSAVIDIIARIPGLLTASPAQTPPSASQPATP